MAPIHPKAMLVILTTEEEWEARMAGNLVDALRLQRPLPDDALMAVAWGEKQDPAASTEVVPGLLL